MASKDSTFMDMALEIAFSKIGRTSPNPSVGAVIVKKGELVSTGGTSPFGKDHAEIVAIKNAGAGGTVGSITGASGSGLLEGAEIYISLEPCCIHSKTPPCTDAIIESGIKRVIIPLLDPNPAVYGKGVEALEKSGIEVLVMNEKANSAYDLLRPFEKYIKKKRPYLIHKSAISIDAKIATLKGDSKWISNEYSRYIAHRLRGIVDAIVVGKNTLINDNPTLNVRTGSFSGEVQEFFSDSSKSVSSKTGNNPHDNTFRGNITGYNNFFLEMLLSSSREFEDNKPLRAVIGLPDAYDPAMNMFRDDNYLFFVNEDKKKGVLASEWKELADAKKIVFIKGKTRALEAGQILDELYKMGKMLVLVEGGGNIAGSFFDAREIDQFLYFIAPKIIGKGVNAIEGVSKDLVADSLSLFNVSSVALHGDLIYNGYASPSLIKEG